MRIRIGLLRPAIILVLAGLGWWTAMFWPQNMKERERIARETHMSSDLKYGWPLLFGIDMNDVASGYPRNIDIWYPAAFVLDGLIWAAVVGCGAMVLLWITRIANPNG
jgi:hypothetical protein